MKSGDIGDLALIIEDNRQQRAFDCTNGRGLCDLRAILC